MGWEGGWGRGVADGIQSGEVLSLAAAFKCCWEVDQGVEGSETAPEQLKALRREKQRIAHLGCEESGLTICVFVPVAVPSSSWTTRPEWCWTSWRRWATTCGP